jgi:hypothetical protein
MNNLHYTLYIRISSDKANLFLKVKNSAQDINK